MRTSKKLLSFFLAVVMAVTSCSVGITAFAAEPQKSIWSTDADANASYDALDQLVSDALVMLLKNDSIRPLLEDNLGMTITDDTTVNDVLGAVQPLLMGLLESSSQSDFEAEQGVSEGTFDYLNVDKYCSVCGNYFHTNDLTVTKDDKGNTVYWCPNGCKNESTVTDEDTGKEEKVYSSTIKSTQLSYFTLVAICKEYKEDRSLSSDERAQLQEWYDKLISYTKYSDQIIYTFIERIQKDYIDVLEETSLTALSDLQNYDFGATDEEMEMAEIAFSIYNAQLDAYGVAEDVLRIDSIADAIFYFHNAIGKKYKNAFMLYDAIKEAGADVTWTGNYAVGGGELFPEFEYNFTQDLKPGDFTDVLADETVVLTQIPVLDDSNQPTTDDNGNPVYHTEYSDKFVIDMLTLSNEGKPPAQEELDRYLALMPSVLHMEAIKLYTDYVLPSHYYDILYGLAIKYSDEVDTKDDLDQLVSDSMPQGWKDSFVLSNDELNEMAFVLLNINSQDALQTAGQYFSGEEYTFNELSKSYTVTLPEALKNTYVAKYFDIIYAKSAQSTSFPDYKGVRLAFFPKADSSSWSDKFVSQLYVSSGGTQDEAVNSSFTNRAVNSDGIPLMKFEFNHKNGIEPNYDTLNAYFASAEEYAYADIVQNLLGIDCLINDENDYLVDFDIYAATDLLAQRENSSGSSLTAEDKKAINTTCDFTGEIGTFIVNDILNSTVMGVVGNETITSVLSSLLVSPVDLTVALDDIWARLNESLVGTIVELLPVLTVVLDELLIPVLFNEEDDKMYAFLTKNFGNSLLGDGKDLNIIDFREYNINNGSYIGIQNLHFNLNELFPALLHLLSGDTEYNYTYYTESVVKLKDIEKLDYNGNPISSGIDTTKYFSGEELDTSYPKYYKVADQEGNVLSRTEGENGAPATFSYMGKSSTDMYALLADYPDAVFTCEMTYKGTVPFITGIYFVDNLLNGVRISDLAGVVAEATGDDQTGAVVSEAVTAIAETFTEAVDIFVATPEYRNDKKIGVGGDTANRGLNNLFVAIPRLLDIYEDLAAEKYGIDKDAWVYCYKGRIETSDGASVNSLLERFKAYAASSDSDRKYDIFDTFAEILIENWLNAIVSIANNVISTDNTIAENLPVVSGLLNALGGFGEESIITDVFNSIFQLTRDDEFSFTFDNENTDKNNAFTGLSKDNAYFLITNLPRLVEVITDLVDKFNAASVSTTAVEETAAAEKVSKAYAATNISAKANASTYSSKDLSNAEDLINNLDKMLSSLLADVTLNDFSLDKTDNIFASVITMLSNYLGKDFSDNADDIVRLIDSYAYYITGGDSIKANSSHDVDAKKVYTNDALTGLVVETYSLVERLAGSLLTKYTGTYQLDDDSTEQYNLLVEAISGIISPDVVSIRLEGDYDSAAKTIAKYNSWTNMTAETSRGDYKVSIDWNIKAGDKDAFFDGLAASLRVLTSVIGVLLIDSGLYDTLVNPVLGAICTPNGIKLTSYETLVADKEKTGYYDETLIAIITPVSDFINLFLSKPATTLVKTVQGLAGILDDKNGVTLASIINGALTTVTDEINGVANIVDSGISNLTPTGAKLIREFTQSLEAYGKTDKNNALVNIKIGNIPLSGANLIPIVNTFISGYGIKLSNLDWNKLSTASTPAAALIYFLEYVLDNLPSILNVIKDSETRDMILKVLSSFSTEDLLGLINQILEASDSPTMAYWIFAQYLQEVATGFKYPAGITAAMANEGVESLDQMVAAIFPLLSSFGLDIGNDLQEVLDKNLFTNSILTQLATALYGALDGLDPTIKTVLNGLGIATSTKDVAKLLTDKSYGATYSSAAKAISAQSSWSKVKNVNWGFKDGSSNAQQGFVNALVAILRPVNDILAVFLNEGTLHIDDAAYEIICGLSISSTTTSFEFNIGDVKLEPKITYSMKNGVLTLTVKDANAKDSQNSTLKIDFKSIKEANDLKLEGTNGYNSAIIPFLEALKCSNVKTYAQYQKDVASAKDNLLLDILNPLFGSSSSSLISKLVAAPATTLTDLLPNIAMYIDGNGLVQLVTNLLAPITYAINDGKNPSNEIGEVIEALLGAPLEDMFIPLINGLLEDMGIVLPDIDWAFLASLGTASSYKSKAVDANGKYLTGKTVDADNGKVLVTVLRYVAEVLINNSTELKNLIVGIDAVKKNDLISSIVKSVFNTIGTASKDELVCAVFYLLSSRPTNAFWDYTKYETGSYTFTYPEGVDVDFLKNLPPMLDGLIGGLLDLNGLVEENLFKDSIISSLATGLYGAVEGVKINDDLNLAQLLAQTDIDFTTDNVAKLLVDEDYGQTYESAASVIKAAGSWKNVNADSLKWGVTDRDSFFHALVAVLRPIYGVLDVLLNDAYLGLFDIVRIPGSNGYSSSIVPLMEAFSMYNIKTQYQYRQDMEEEYDAILLDIINPLWDLVEDVLNAPIQTIAKIVPNLALFIGNDGLCQIIENLFTPISALADAIRPIVDLNSLLTTVLGALDVDLNSILGKVGVTNFSLDLYDLKETLKPLLGGDALIPLINNILPMIKIGGSPLGLKLNPVDWLQLASHGTTVVSASQAATFGSRIYVEGDSSETLIAVLKYLIITINTGENYDVISDLIGGLIGGADSDMSGTISQVLTVIKGDTDTVIASLVELLQTIA